LVRVADNLLFYRGNDSLENEKKRRKFIKIKRPLICRDRFLFFVFNFTPEFIETPG
jgi:hypothetical protein